jgi:tetratricopeptide (TPR) repeat protein
MVTIRNKVTAYMARIHRNIDAREDFIERITKNSISFISRLLSSKIFLTVLFVITTVTLLAIYQGDFAEPSQIEEQHLQIQIVSEILGRTIGLKAEKPFKLSLTDEETLFIHGLQRIEAGNAQEGYLIASFLNENATRETTLGGSYWLTGRVLLLDEDAETDPEESFRLCMDVYEEISQESGRYRCLLGLIDANLQKGQVAEARRWLTLAFRLALKADLPLSLYHARAGLVSLSENDFENAILHFQQEAELHESNGETSLAVDVYTILVTLHLLFDDNEKAQHYHQLSAPNVDEEKQPVTFFHARANEYLLNHCETSEQFNTEQVHVYRRSLIKSAVKKVCGS